MHYCCNQLKEAVRDENIDKRQNKFYIYGYPTYANDGEQLDDMTETIEMLHCPSVVKN